MTTHQQSIRHQESKHAPGSNSQQPNQEERHQPSTQSHAAPQSKKASSTPPGHQHSTKHSSDQNAQQQHHAKKSNKRAQLHVDSENENESEFNDPTEEIAVSGKRPVAEPHKHKAQEYTENMTEE